MTPPAFSTPSVTVYCGDALTVLRELPDASVDCCVTSPPYWGLRDYGTATWEDGSADCEHSARTGDLRFTHPISDKQRSNAGSAGSVCVKCGATRTDCQLGLERTPAEYVARMVEVFAEVRRVLTDRATLWLNLGSSYASNNGDRQTGRNDDGQLRDAPATWARYDIKRTKIVSRGSGPSRSPAPKRAPAYGSDGTGPQGSKGPGSAYPDLCDECRVALSRRSSGTPPLPLGDEPRPLPTDRDTEPVDSEPASLAASPLAVPVSTMTQSDSPPLGQCSHCGNCGACLSVLRSSSRDAQECARKSWLNYTTFKPKDMVPIPWMVALALQADGWYLRSDIIWSKPNPMPESVTDRPTKAHEYVFLLSKSERYFYDADAIAEPMKYVGLVGQDASGYKDAAFFGGKNAAPHDVRNDTGRDARASWNGSRFDDGKNLVNHPNVGRRDDAGRDGARVAARSVSPPPERGWDTTELLARGRNARTVWTIATQPYPEAHFATFPRELPERCIKAGCPERVCETCGKASERISERPTGPTFAPLAIESSGALPEGRGTHRNMGARYQKHLDENPRTTTGWTDCGHDAYRSGVVLDPFAGSGTTLAVARDLGRKGIGIELSPEYVRLIEGRCAQLAMEITA